MIRLSIHKKLAMAAGPGALCIDMTIQKGEFVVLYGASGVGKTSLLRIIAGLLQPENGHIISDHKVWLDTENNVDVPVQKRNIGFVFQDLALFPNMTVLENIQYAVKSKREGNAIIQLLKMVHLEGLADRKPDMLSGGQRQRVALIRALAGQPELLLLDEPFSSLDIQMHGQLREDLHMLHKEFNLTTLLVTHDLADVYHLADRVIVIDNGIILKSGKPNAVFGIGQADGMIQVKGELLSIKKSGVIYIAEILIGSTITQLVISEEEQETLRPGMQVLICSGAFDPVIKMLR